MLHDDRAGNGQAGGRHACQRQVLVDCDFEPAGAVDHRRPLGRQPAEQVHAKHHVFKAAARHAADHGQIGCFESGGQKTFDGRGVVGGVFAGPCRLHLSRQLVPAHRRAVMATGFEGGQQSPHMPAGRFADHSRPQTAASMPAHRRHVPEPLAAACGVVNDAFTISGATPPKRCRRPVSTLTRSTKAGANRAGSSA